VRRLILFPDVAIVSRAKAVQGVGNKNAGAHRKDNSRDDLCHIQSPARSSPVTKDRAAQSKQFHQAVELGLEPKDFQQRISEHRSLAEGLAMLLCWPADASNLGSLNRN